MKILVTGGRDYTDEDFINKTLDRLNKIWGIDCLVHGNARGVDYLCGQWAGLNQVKIKSYPVTKKDYDRFGIRAPLIRNSTMLENENPDLVVVFPGGRGTKDMMNKAVADNCFVLDLVSNRVIKPMGENLDFTAYMKKMSSKNDGNTKN